MALAKSDPEQASYLFENFLSLQHDNGMIPHIGMWATGWKGKLSEAVNWKAGKYPRFDLAGNLVKTTPITQPPMLAIAAAEIMDALPESEREAFAKRTAPILIRYHDWFYREREINGDGLVATIHPHETGRDDAPSHIDLMHAIEHPVRERLFLKRSAQWLIGNRRTDKTKDMGVRSDTDTIIRGGLLAIFRLAAVKEHISVHQQVPRSHQYLHFDPGLNAILDRANDELVRLAEAGNIEVPESLRAAMLRTAGGPDMKTGLQLLWDPVQKGFRGLDAHGRVTLQAGQEIGDILPIFSDHLTDEQTYAIMAKLADKEQFGGDHLSSVNRSSDRYDPPRFWQGADWPQIRMLVMDGLYRKNNEAADGLATKLGLSALSRAVLHNAMSEYHNSLTGTPEGGHDFSWGAGMIISVLHALARRGELPDFAAEAA